jgi:AraC family transcriptional regulator of adaptative response / DNA-3-methyladenine glycosylase II
VFRASPTALRARRRASDRLVADGGLSLRLPFEGPLDWDLTLRYLAARAIPGVESVSGTAYRRTIVVGGDPGMLELLPGGRDHLVLRAHLPYWEELIHVVDRARRIPNLELALEEPARRLARDPIIGPSLRVRPGLRPPGTWDGFETGVRAILGQQVTIAGANTLAGRLIEQMGEPVAGLEAFGLTHTFPPPERVADADLTHLGVPRARAEAVRSFARAVADDAVRLDRSVDLDGLVASLTALDGLGPWTAHYLALRLGEPDACPLTDLGVRRALQRVGIRSAAAVREAADEWRPWRALAVSHLWAA